MRTGKCIKAYQGSSVPTIGTKLIINSGCNDTTFQFDYIYSEIPTTKVPSTTTTKPSAPTNTPLATTKAPSTTTKAPSATTNTPSTTTNKPSEITILSTTNATTTKKNILDCNRDNQSGNKNESALTVSFIVIAVISCLLLIILVIYFIPKWKKIQELKRQNVLNNSNRNEEVIHEIFFDHPSTEPGAISIQEGKRPIPLTTM